jgi:hypothetical protein
MKKLALLLIAVGLAWAIGSWAQAAVVTIRFDPNDLVNLYPSNSSGLKETQQDARRIHQQWGSNFYNTFSDYLASGHSQPSDYGTYVSWLNSLSAGEGIACFNSWFLNNPAASSWGEKVVSKPGSVFYATAGDGWSVDYIVNPYNLGGTSAQWYTTDSSKYLRPGGADIGIFSITADLYWDSGPSGWDANDKDVLPGDVIRFWLGCLNGDDPGFYRTDTQALYFDNSGPFGAVYSSQAGVAGSGFEAAMHAIAEVPEPATLIVWSLLGGVSWLGMRVVRRGRPAGRQPWSPENRQAIHAIIARGNHP